MPIPAVVDSLDSVPAALRSEYVPAPADSPIKGKFVAHVEAAHGYGLEHIVGLKSSVEAARAERDALKAKVSAWGDLDPVQTRADLALVEKAKSAIPKEQFDAAVGSEVGKTKKSYEEKLAEAEKRLEARGGKLRNALVTMEARRALIAAGATPKGAELLLNVVDKIAVIDGIDGDGMPKVKLKNGSGGFRISAKTGKNDEMDLDEYAETLRDEYPEAFSGGGSKGSGATGGGGKGAGSVFSISRADSKDALKYRAAKAAAEKAGQRLVITD